MKEKISLVAFRVVVSPDIDTAFLQIIAGAAELAAALLSVIVRRRS